MDNFGTSYLVHPGTPVLDNRVSIPDQPGVTTGNADRDYAAWYLGLGPEYSGDRIDHETALTYSAVWGCVRVISESLSVPAWHVYERSEDSRQRQEIEDDIAWMIGMQANPEMNAFEWRQLMLKNALTWGNGYAEIERTGGGKPNWLWPLHPSRVTPVRDDAKRLWYEVKNGPGVVSTYLAPSDVFHLKGIGPDGLVGYSVIEMARCSIKLGLQQEAFGSDFFGRGTMPGGVVTIPGKLNPEQRREYRRSFEEVYAGRQNSHRIVVLSDGITFDPSTLPNDDAQFLESRQFQVTEICRWYRVPPHKIADLTRSTFSNIEDQNREFASDCLLPWSRRLESEANVKFYGRTSRGRRFTRVDMEELQRGNSQQQTDNVTRRVAGGIITPNEGRKSLDLDPMDGGDVLLVQGAMTTLERVVEPPEPVAPAMPPETPAEPAMPAMPDPKKKEMMPPAPDASAARRVFGLLLSEAYGRIYRVNIDKAKRAGNKGGDGLARHIDEHYADSTVSQVQAMLSPAFAAAVLALGGSEATGWSVAGLAAKRHVARCRADLQTYGVRALITWEVRPAEVAAAEIAGLIRDYSEDQERDESGRFGSGGGSGEADSTRQDARDAHDEKVSQERDKADEARDSKREAEDKQAEKESEKIDQQREHEDAAREAESEKIDQQREAEDKATETKREAEDKVTAEAERATDAERQKADDERDAGREAEDKVIDDKAEREEITDAERISQHAANDKVREREDKATDARREKEDAVREREAERTDKAREKEDAAREAKREREDAKREAEQEKIDQKREAEDKARERHEAAVEKQRKEEDDATQRQREREDRAKEKARQEEDAGKQTN